MKETIYIPYLEVVQEFGYLIKGRGKFSGLDFAKRILNSGEGCPLHREACASSVASTVCEIVICGVSGCCMITEM